MLLVVSGPPGVGKSAVAPQVAQGLEPSVLVAGDVFFGFLADGRITPWLPEARQQNMVVTDAAAAAAGFFVRGGYNTVYDGYVVPAFLSRFACCAELDELHYAVLSAPIEVCIARIERRRGHGFSDIPATRRMYGEFDASGVDQRHVIDASTDPVSRTADLVLRAYQEGALIYRAS